VHNVANHLKAHVQPLHVGFTARLREKKRERGTAHMRTRPQQQERHRKKESSEKRRTGGKAQKKHARR
jgi:hypothetical protein